MNCQEFWTGMLCRDELGLAAPPEGPRPSAFHEQMAAVAQLENAAALANRQHLAHCPACAARLRSHLALKKGLKAVAGQMSRIEAPPRVEARLRAAFRAHAGLEPGSSQSIRARARWIPASTWAAAAAALFAIAAFLSGDLFVGSRQPELAATAVRRGVETAVAGMPAEIETEGGTPMVESGFIPLPNATQIGPNEEVNLVRVEVPRLAMIALGYDVKPEEASASVQADVMLGNDGLARAVRFLD